MLGLCMYEEYLIDILNGYRTYDVRLCATPKRGKIGLIKSKSNLLYGYVEFVSVEQITYEEYVYWHVGENYSLNDAKMHIEGIRRSQYNKHKRAYKYNFINPILLECPVKVLPIKKEGSWIEFDEEAINKTYKKQSLF